MKVSIFIVTAGLLLSMLALPETVSAQGVCPSSDGVGFYYDMETLDGSDMADLDTDGNNDGIIAGTTDVIGQFGQSRDFDGIDDGITVSGSLDIVGEATVAGWVSSDTPASSRIFFYFKQTGSSTDVLFVGHYNDGRILASRESSASTSRESTTLLSGSFHHVAVTKTGAGVLKIFVDGVADDNPAAANWDTTTADGQTLGRSTGTFHDGKLDEVYFFDRVLADNEILGLSEMQCGFDAPPPPPADIGIADFILVAILVFLFAFVFMIGIWKIPFFLLVAAIVCGLAAVEIHRVFGNWTLSLVMSLITVFILIFSLDKFWRLRG